MRGALLGGALPGRALLGCAIIAGLLSWHSAVFADDRQKQLEALKERIGELQSSLDRKRKKRSAEQQALREVETRIGALQRDLRETTRALQRQQAQLEELNQRKKALQSKRARQQALIEQQVLAAYQLGQEKKLKVLLNQDSPDRLSRALVYYDYFNKARAEQIDSYMTTIAELNDVTPAIERKTAELSASRDRLAKKRDALTTQQQRREATLATLDKQIGSSDQRLQAMHAEQDELLKLLSALEEEIANISLPESYSPFHTRRGKLAWPAEGKHLNRFGTRRGDSRMNWQGIEIAASAGSEVRAIHHGRVVFSDWLRGAGLLIIVDHGDGYMSLYGHNQSLLYDTGDWVKAGDVIATVGSSGGRNHASLYFEIRKNGRPTNPASWCRG